MTYRNEGDLDRAEVPFEKIGVVGGDALSFGESTVTLAQLREEHRRFFHDWMEA